MTTAAVRWAGISAARQQLAQLAQALQDHEGVRERAAEKIRARIESVAKSRLKSHQDTGAAASSLTVAAAGGIVLQKANRYLDYHTWWPFRRGMPPFIVKYASEVFAREFLSTIGETTGELGEIAVDLVSGADARAKSAEERKAAAKKRAEDRKLDKVTREREKRDG